jgi:lipoprotein-releasing system ATP-binding protein
MNELILKAGDIIKTYETAKKVRLQVLKSVSLSIEQNKITVIVGASGAGKSTLLHILGGLDRPDNGKVIFKDDDLFKLSDEKLAKFRNKNIGFIFQFHHLLPEFTAAENIAIPQMISGSSLSDSLQRASKLLAQVGLDDRENHKPAELSGGEQQRVAVARALANNPDIVFADEPTGNLDSVNSESINQIILNLRDNHQKTFVIVTHNPELVKLADKVYEMKDGNILLMK